MDKMFGYAGNLFAYPGMLVWLVALVGRLTGNHVLMGFQSATLFVGGLSLILIGIFFKVEQLVRTSGD